MRLIDLDPEWVFEYDAVSHAMRRASDLHSSVHSPTCSDPDFSPDPRPETSIDIGRAQGVMFLCPACFATKGPKGTESVICWFDGRGVPADALPGPGRWSVSGVGFDDLSLSPSVNVDSGHWHGWVTNGEIK